MATNTLGRYQIIREIARSNDIVYEARDPVMGRRVAVKELAIPPTLNGQARRERIERFFREAKAAGSLSPHPHIVTIYEVGQQGERYFIAMEYLEGQPLREILQMDGPMPLERAKRIAVQVCEALDYAHARGVIHRDIKPDNIHILPGDVVKLTDFGIARIAADPSITADGQVFGTPSYMSPEQVAGRALDARTDLYSLGVMLYEMLVGRKPFTGDTVVTITYNIMNQDLPQMPGVPPEIQEVVRRAMSKVPDARFRSAGEMRAALLAGRAAAPARNPTVMGYPAPAAGRGMPAGMPAPGYSSPVTIHPGPAGPEPTDANIPPLYVPRRPSALGQAMQRNAHFLSVLGYAVLLSLACVFFIWASSTAYRNYQGRERDAQAAGYVQQGNTLFNQKRYVEALGEYRHAMEIAPATEAGRVAREGAAAAEINQGNDLLNQRLSSQAASHYTAALEYDSRSTKAHYGLATAYNGMGTRDDAIREWEWVVQNGSDPAITAQARNWLAATYLSLGQESERTDPSLALQWYDKCVNADPVSQYAEQAQSARERLVGASLPPG